MQSLKRAVHIDFHTSPGIEDFGANFDASQFAATLKNARVEWINFFAKCNQGYAYYPTKVGIMYPGLTFDLLGEVVKECHKAGIRVTAYLNGGRDREMARRRRDWAIVNAEGQVISGDRTNQAASEMCLRSGYRDYLLAMIKEIVDNYPVDGIFLDAMIGKACYGHECVGTMKEAGLNPLNPEHVLTHGIQGKVDFCREVKKLVGEGKWLYFNGMRPPVTTKGVRTHWEIECLPSNSASGGYDLFPMHAAYTRNLGQPVLYMTGRFQLSWGDFGGLKSKTSLENDCWDALMNAVGTSIGDHMHPRDGLEPAVYRIIGEIYNDIECLEPWTDEAEAMADIAIVTEEHVLLGKPHAGAARMLGELKYTYDIVDETMELSKYRLLILPDSIPITSTLQEKIRAHLVKGGGVISSGHSGLDPEKSRFAMPEWNMMYEGEDPCNQGYFRMRDSLAANIPDMPSSMYNEGIRMRQGEGSQVIADYIEPYYNRHWDGADAYRYTPANKKSDRPALVRSGNIIHCCFDIFTAYREVAYLHHKYLIQYCLEQLLPDPLIRCENIPSTARVTVTAKKGMLMVHIKATHPEQRGNMSIVEEHAELHHATVRLRMGKEQQIKRIYEVPSQREIGFTVHDGYASFDLPAVKGYMIVAAEI